MTNDETPMTPPEAAAVHTSGGRRPRSGPIVAGTLLLVLCAYVAVRTAGGSIDATTWIIATIIGLGALLLIVGIAVLVRTPRKR